MDYNNNYRINIFERYNDLLKSKKESFDNNNLSKIFEYYSCIKLTEEYKKQFYEYNDIDPTFKELNKMSRNDTGIDCSDLDNTIVQCKLRKNNLNWKECSTFFGSQNIFCNELKKSIIRWNNLIITRNDDSTLSENLLERKELFIDKQYNKDELINFCNNLIINPPIYQVFNEDFKLRDYQIEAIDIIKNNKKNVIINLPTGTGKNSVIIYSMNNELKYLILVPRIILMEQLKNEIIKHNSKIKNKIQLIGDGNNIFDENKLITICVFNSVHLIEKYCMNFEKIYIDEAHHIDKPEIYYNEEYSDDIDNELIISNDDEYYTDDIDNETIISNDEYYSDNELINEDDINDELVNVKNYTKIIKSLVKYNNNVYLSATIDPINNFEYYSKDIRTMIDLKYLCDYTIQIPIFNDDPTNKNICEYLLKEYKNIIIYCSSCIEGKKINKLMNDLQLNSCEYIDCNTPKKKRNTIIDKYKNGEIPFLVNVRILVEGFDAPITKGVCFFHLPTNKTTLIQIIGRCLRLHPTKNIANVILPFSLEDEDKSICNFLKIISKNDTKIKKSYENKRLGGYISIESVEEIDDEDVNYKIELKYNMVYNSLGIIKNGLEIWMKKLEMVENYIIKNNKRPSKHDKDKEIKKLGIWVCVQQKKNSKNEYIMKDETIKQKWKDFTNKYIHLFLSNDESWNNNLNLTENYIIKNNKKPLSIDKDHEIKKLGIWITRQQMNYLQNEKNMKDENVKKKWKDFTDKYIHLFLSNNESWNNNLNLVENYIIKNNKRPSQQDKDNEIKKLGIWVCHQQNNYEKNEQIMKDTNIKQKWKDFTNKYIHLFLSNDELWNNNLNLVENYIIKNNKRPSQIDKDDEIKKLGSWISTQKMNYEKNDQIMKNETIKKKWKDFTNKYIHLFLSNDELWNNNLNLVENYIIKNNIRPYQQDKDNEIKKLGSWISTQQMNYEKNENSMKDETIKKKWNDFYNKYIHLFLSNYEAWNNNLNLVENFIIMNNKRPSQQDKDTEIKKLGRWISNQQNNYLKNKYIMKDEIIKKKWKDFTDKYKNFFK
jgi:superfamily II DNA or RNA helicase